MKNKIALVFLLSSFAFISCDESKKETNDKAVEVQQKDTESATESKDEVDYLAFPEDARVFFKNLEDGTEVTSPFQVEMGVEGIALDPAGDLIYHSGHHHIIINGSYYELGETIPMDETNLHYGQAQTEAELDLEPGDYTLTMQYANGYHQSYGEELSAEINIKVVE